MRPEAPKIRFQHDDNGYPILPSLEDMSRYGLPYKKQVLGRFMTEVYSTWVADGCCRLSYLAALAITTNATNGRVPWSKLDKHRQEYIKSEYLPEENIELKQYYHLLQGDIDLMLKHWVERQAAGKIPLKFRKAAIVAG
jgi:hypothetical protein